MADSDPARLTMSYGVLFSALAGVLAVRAVTAGGPAVLLLWPALAFAVVAVGYLGVGPGVFGKRPDGRIAPLHAVVLLPHLALVWCVWHLTRLVRRQPAVHRLNERIFIGRRLCSAELSPELEITHVVDLTCELREPRALRALSYFSFPVLDASAPSASQLREWVERVASLEGRTFVHCAEGHGRTGLFAAQLLLHTGEADSVEAAMELIRSKRPRVRLSRAQRAVLEELAHSIGDLADGVPAEDSGRRARFRDA